MARNDLRARGGGAWGGREAPHQLGVGAEESKEQQGNRLEAKERKTAQLDEDPPGQRESKHIKTENDSGDDWVWDFDLDKVINAYQILVKKTKVRRYVFHSEAEK